MTGTARSPQLLALTTWPAAVVVPAMTRGVSAAIPDRSVARLEMPAPDWAVWALPDRATILIDATTTSNVVTCVVLRPPASAVGLHEYVTVVSASTAPVAGSGKGTGPAEAGTVSVGTLARTAGAEEVHE